MDLHENAEKNIVTASFEFPGLTKNDVQISVHNGRLTVAADPRRLSEEDSEKGHYAVRERHHFGRLWRTLQLPLGVKVNLFIYLLALIIGFFDSFFYIF